MVNIRASFRDLGLMLERGILLDTVPRYQLTAVWWLKWVLWIDRDEWTACSRMLEELIRVKEKRETDSREDEEVKRKQHASTKYKSRKWTNNPATNYNVRCELLTALFWELFYGLFFCSDLHSNLLWILVKIDEANQLHNHRCFLLFLIIVVNQFWLRYAPLSVHVSKELSSVLIRVLFVFLILHTTLHCGHDSICQSPLLLFALLSPSFFRPFDHFFQSIDLQKWPVLTLPSSFLRTQLLPFEMELWRTRLVSYFSFLF